LHVLNAAVHLRQKLEQTIAGKSDGELYDIACIHSADYSSAAVEIANEERRRRSLDDPLLSRLANAAEEEWKREHARLGWPLRTVAFFITTVGIGIPAMIAYRRFVNVGYRRKAHEWIEWGFFGFVFYATLWCALNM
jgi:hypothetical protein